MWTPPLHTWLSNTAPGSSRVQSVMGVVPWALEAQDLEAHARSSVSRMFLRPRIEAVLSLVSGACASATRAILSQAVAGVCGGGEGA